MIDIFLSQVIFKLYYNDWAILIEKITYQMLMLGKTFQKKVDNEKEKVLYKISDYDDEDDLCTIIEK